MLKGESEMGRNHGFAALAIAAALCAPRLVQADQLSPRPAGHDISAYDYQITSDGKHVRLKMESVKGERVYSSFVDGALIASARIQEASQKTGDAIAFNEYLKASSAALVQAGVDPKSVGLSYMNAAFDNAGTGAGDLRKAAEAPSDAASYGIGVTAGKPQ
jgi:hypothetical protein